MLTKHPWQWVAMINAGLLLGAISCIKEPKNRREPTPAKTPASTAGTDNTTSDTGSSGHSPAPCAGCHEKDRPAAPHAATGDCSTCHTFPDWKTIATSSGTTHDGKETSCAGCHEKDRPAAPHYGTTDCISCHKIAGWSPSETYSHSPKPASCAECHDKDKPAAASSRAYPAVGTPTDYTTDGTYPGSGHFYGKDCVTCHLTPAEGQSQFAFTHSKPAANFCLPCHFADGKAKHGTTSTSKITKQWGNCYNCHKSFDAAQSRSW